MLQTNNNEQSNPSYYSHVRDGHPREQTRTGSRLAQDFSQQVRNRSFNNNLKAECHDPRHLLPNFDSDNPVKESFIFDFNVMLVKSGRGFGAISWGLSWLTARFLVNSTSQREAVSSEIAGFLLHVKGGLTMQENTARCISWVPTIYSRTSYLKLGWGKESSEARLYLFPL